MTERASVWVVDDDESIRWVLEKALGGAGLDVQTFPGGVEMLDALDEATPQVLLTDVRMRGIDGLELLSRVREREPALPVIIMTAHSDLDSAVAAYQGGAFEYLPKPFDVDEATELVLRASRLAPPRAAEPASKTEEPASKIVGEAPAMQEVFRAIGRLSRSQITVLITGQSGTGKELVARALHEHSPRAAKPFIAVNTPAIPKDLMESEFFGHERGAFTGAQTQYKGRFEQAHGGSLFLDEIGDMPADLQTRLLRVLADGKFYRVGGHQPVSVNVRIIAATNQDLEQAVAEGRFREDLYHRLNVIRVRMPSLRERREDVPLLLEHFLARAASELDIPPKRLSAEVVEFLADFDWPGNVRQVENICRWITVMAPAEDVDLDDLPSELRQPMAPPLVAGQPAQAPVHPSTSADPQNDAAVGGSANGTAVASSDAMDWLTPLSGWARAALAAGEDGIAQDAVRDVERAVITEALRACQGHRQEAARRLGWGRNTLTRKIKELNLD